MPVTASTVALFIYGTLRYAPLFTLVAGSGGGVCVDAALPGHRVMAAMDGLPLLGAVPDDGTSGLVAPGQLWRGLDAGRLARLDRYEVPFGYFRRPVSVLADAGPVAAEAYFPPVDMAATQEPWDLDRWITAHGAVTLHAAVELVSHQPEMSGEAMVRQWPMMRARAEARHRADTTRRPATLRRTAQPGDVTLRQVGPTSGSFFKFAELRVDHLRFDGTRATDLSREVFVGVDAALVLPYDPVRDRVLLVEQMRLGPAARGDTNPWTLEPVAGIIDAGETPGQAARREAAEEAGLEFASLEPMFAAYASPGSSTDFFHCFVGFADLPDTTVRHGGLASEAEDLALHRLSFDAALTLVASGEITALPLIAMLHWLAAHRARLREAARASA